MNRMRQGKSNQKLLEVIGSAYADQHLLSAIVSIGKFLDQEF